jgi:hypothetical protein
VGPGARAVVRAMVEARAMVEEEGAAVGVRATGGGVVLEGAPSCCTWV